MSQFVPSSVIAKLVEGSYEHVTARLDDLVSEADEGVRRKVIATFPTHAVVAEEDGQFSKISYAPAADGTIKLVGSEPIRVQTYTPERVTEFVFHEASEIVGSFLSGGSPAETLDRIEGLLPFINEGVKRKTETEAVESALAAVKAPRVWRTLYAERSDLIQSVLGDVQAEAVEPKFNVLSDGTIPAERHDGYRELVHSDLNHLARHVEGLAESVEAALEVIADVKEHATTAEQGATLATFETFSTDLASDLKGLALLIGESLKNVQTVANLGKLYDGLAAEFTNHKIAGQFVQQMAEKLCESDPQQ